MVEGGKSSAFGFQLFPHIRSSSASDCDYLVATMLSFVSTLTVALLCAGGSLAAPAGIERRGTFPIQNLLQQSPS